MPPTASRQQYEMCNASLSRRSLNTRRSCRLVCALVGLAVLPACEELLRAALTSPQAVPITVRIVQSTKYPVRIVSVEATWTDPGSGSLFGEVFWKVTLDNQSSGTLSCDLEAVFQDSLEFRIFADQMNNRVVPPGQSEHETTDFLFPRESGQRVVQVIISISECR